MDFVDRIYNYKGIMDADSRCGLKVVKKPDHHIVIATELYEENPGTSVTDFNSRLAGRVVEEFSLDPEKLIFIEQCPDRGSRRDHYRQTFDRVRFHFDGTCFSDPDWERISREEVEELVKDPLGKG
jgi:hypothetical protein